jgi:hypothetical protein
MVPSHNTGAPVDCRTGFFDQLIPLSLGHPTVLFPLENVTHKLLILSGLRYFPIFNKMP